VIKICLIKTKKFQELLVWQKAHSFVLAIYHYTASFPKVEMYSLSTQFRRAAISIAANIAEGYKKKSKLDKARFFNISQGSLEECQYYLILSKDLGYDENNSLFLLLDEVSRKFEGYLQKLLSSDI